MVKNKDASIAKSSGNHIFTCSGGFYCQKKLTTCKWLGLDASTVHTRHLPRTLRNGFDLEAKLLGVDRVVRVRRATPPFYPNMNNLNSLSKGLWLSCIVAALKNRFNTLSSYKLVLNQSDKRYSIYLEKRDRARENCRKIQIS